MNLAYHIPQNFAKLPDVSLLFYLEYQTEVYSNCSIGRTGHMLPTYGYPDQKGRAISDPALGVMN
jgi:hypothetical protein